MRLFDEIAINILVEVGGEMSEASLRRWEVVEMISLSFGLFVVWKKEA